MSVSVMYDGESFLRHARGGIPRYLVELISAFEADPALEVKPVTPYKWVASRHLAERDRRFVEVPLPRRVRYPVLRRLNERRLRSVAPSDIVHHSYYQPDAFQRWPGRLHVTTVYDFIVERFPEALPPGNDHIERHNQVIRQADAVICISDATRQDLHHFVPGFDKPAFTVPLGVGPDFFDPAPTKLPALPERYVLFVGNRTAHKNIDLLLGAFAELARRDRDLHLVLVGAPAPAENTRIAHLGITDRTHQLRVSDAVIPWIYRRATVLVYTSRWEGFGLPVVEAMASGCPAVVANVAALAEVGGDAVLTFEPSDHDGLIDAAERVLSNPAEQDRLRAAGLQRAQLFTWRRTAEETAKVYHEIAQS